MRAPWILTLSLLLLLGCSSGGSDPTAPAQLPDAPTATLAEEAAQSGTGVLGVYEAVLDFAEGTVDLNPVEAPREGTAISDFLTPDITPYLTNEPCIDCFQVKAISKNPDGRLQVDFGLRHPFPTTEKRADLSVFDTRAILIMPGSTVFPTSPKIHLDADQNPDRTVLGNFDLLVNADGYTSHFDEKVEDTRYFNPPLDITGTVNPYITFFTETNPDPTINGAPIPSHRFAQTPVMDVQRFLFNLGPGDTQQVRVIIVLEAQYGVSATWAQTRDFPGTPGSRTNPVYFLPAFNQAEAVRILPTLTDNFTTNDPPDRELVAQITVEDWQAGLIGNASYGNLTQPALIPLTSDVIQVTAEIPGLMDTISELDPLPTSGTGAPGDPYRYEWLLRNERGAPAGDYVGLITVRDSLDGTARGTADPGTILYSFNAYQVLRVKVIDNGTNTPPTAVADALPNPVDSGAQIALIDRDSFDPDAGDGITLYEWDFDISDGRDYLDSVSTDPDQASTLYINPGVDPITVTASVRVTDMFAATDFADIEITVNPPMGQNNPPVAIAEASPNPVIGGETVQFIDHDSFDPDPGDDVVLYEWDFDVSDGRDYTDSVSPLADAATTSYPNPGTDPITVTASLRVTDMFSATDFMDVVITIDPEDGNHAPVAVAEAIATEVESGETVEFIDSNSYDPDPLPDKVVEYAWDYDVSDGRTYTDKVSTIPNRATTAYTNATNQPIDITASLRVKDTFGLTDTEDIVITVAPGLGLCEDPLAPPQNFAVPVLPEPPYNVNFITFTWDATPDPNGCLRGYAVWRSKRVGADTSFKLLTDLDGDNQLDDNEIITDTTFADSTLGGPGNPTTNSYYMYVVRSVSQSSTGLKQSVDSSTVFAYFNDFEGMNQLTGGTWRGTRSGFSWGLVNALAYPDLNAFNYGFEIATNEGNTGTHCLDESADIAAGGYGPTNHSPYAAGSNFDPFIDDGYWNSFGPQLFTDLDTNPVANKNTRVMQLFHKYQMETYFDAERQVEVAADMGYVCVTSHANWEQNRFNQLIDLPIIDGKGYDSAAPGVNPFLDQQYWPAGDRNPTQQIPAMHFLAGDYRTPEAGAPDWTKSVFDLTPARNMTQPVIQFGFAGDEYPQVASHIGWSIDDILIVAY